MHKLLLIIVFVFAPLTAIAQAPKWINRPPQSISGNYTYTFIETSANALTLDAGRNKCLQMLSLDRGLMNSLTISYRGQEEIHSNSTTVNSEFNENIQETMVEVITYDGKSIEVTARIIDEYYNQKNSMMHTLYQVGITDNPIFDMAYTTNKYGAKGLMSVIPGLGQFYKHHYLKGGLMLGGTAVLAGGIIFTEVCRADYAKKIGMTHDKKAMAVYANRRNNFALARNICIGATAALYVYNLVDAIITPGAKYIKFQKVNRNGSSYSLAPTVTYDGTPAAAATVTF